LRVGIFETGTVAGTTLSGIAISDNSLDLDNSLEVQVAGLRLKLCGDSVESEMDDSGSESSDVEMLDAGGGYA